MFIFSNLFIAFLLFAVVTSITPGPNNILLLTSGVNFGLRRTMPHLWGVVTGFTLMVLIVGLGLGELLSTYPIAYKALCYISAVYLIYLAWRIFQSSPAGEKKIVTKPMSFLQAVLFQWVNPKAWIMAVAAITTYVPSENFFINIILIACIFGFLFLPCGLIWISFGTGLRYLLNQPKHLRIFNTTMAVLLLLSLYPIVADII